MLVQSEYNSSGRNRPGALPPGILDSPTLARVERAMLRHQEGSNRENDHLYRAACTQSLLSSNFAKDSTTHAIKRGLLWQQKDKLFSRWKERYFILTRDYLHCFRRASGSDRISEMGQFLFKVKLIDVDKVEWENKKTYSTVVLILGRDGKIYLRATDGLEDWFELLEECTFTSKERRRALRHSTDSKRENNNISSNWEEWLAARQKIPMGRQPSDSVSTSTSKQESVRRREWTSREDDWENPTLDNRLSLLTDIDINSYDDSTLGAPSVTSYRMNQDVLCIQPPSLRPLDSLRSTKDYKDMTEAKHKPCKIDVHSNSQCIKFRERSYSDIQHMERRPWRAVTSTKQFI